MVSAISAFVEPSVSEGPHAPWWAAPEGNPPSPIQTGQITGVLYERGFAHPWLDGATTVMFEGVPYSMPPDATHVAGTLYGNTGDWVESCTALIESERGELSLLRWPETAHARPRPAASLVADAA